MENIYAVPQYTIVDGVTRFDINEDAIDMRIDIDPDEKIPAFFEAEDSHDHENDGCLQGVHFHNHHENH